jgi:hypothetical protein
MGADVDSAAVRGMSMGFWMPESGRCHASPIPPPPALTQFSSQFPRWEAIGIVDMATDVALFFMSVLLVKDLQMSWQPKAVVVAAFGTRVL